MNDNDNAEVVMNDGVAVTAPTEEQKAAFAAEILHRMKTVERRHSYSGLTHIQDVHTEDLETIVFLLVYGDLIPYPSGEYTSAFHEQVGYFLEEFFGCTTGNVEYYEADGHVYFLALGHHGMEYDTDPNYFVNTPIYEVTHVHNAFIHQNISKLHTLIALRLNGWVRMPKELEQIESLTQLHLQGPEFQNSEQFPPWPGMKLKYLESLYLPDFVQHSLISWLSNSQFPALKKLEVGKPDLELFNAFVDKHLLQLTTLRVKGGESDDAIDNFHPILLQILPQCAPYLQNISLIPWRTSADLIQKQLSRIVEELQAGNFHPSFLSTLSMNLESFSVGQVTSLYTTEKPWKKQLTQLLPFFKRLSSFPWLVGKIGNDKFENTASIYDSQIDYMMFVNYGGGRLLIPGTTTLCTDAPKDTPTCVELNHPVQHIPLGLWPRVIARAQLSPGKEFPETEWPESTEYTAMFRMLRPNSDCLGPALERILDSKPNNFKSKKRKTAD